MRLVGWYCAAVQGRCGDKKENDIPQVPSQLDPGIKPCPRFKMLLQFESIRFQPYYQESQFVFTGCASEQSPGHFKMPQLIAITQYLQFEGYLPKMNPNLHQPFSITYKLWAFPSPLVTTFYHTWILQGSEGTKEYGTLRYTGKPKMTVK